MMPLGLKNSQESSSSPDDTSLLQDPETTWERFGKKGTRCRKGWETTRGIRPGGAKQSSQVGPWFISTGGLPWLQAQGFSSEKAVSLSWVKDPHKAERK